jgi:hypothetical protein
MDSPNLSGFVSISPVSNQEHKVKNHKHSLGLMALATFMAMPATAGPFTIGDVFASVGGGLVREFSPTGTLVQTLNTNTNSPFTTGSAFDSSGNFYVTTFNSGVLSKFSTGSLSGVNFATIGGDQESITIGTSGVFYVGEADGGGQISKHLSSDGSLVQNYIAAVGPRGTDWIDLAADQTTIYYTSEGSTIRRFSTVGAGSQLADFETGKGGTMFALRILANGGVLVANTSNVLQFDSAGNIAKTYSIPGANTLFALNLDPDGITYWTGDLSTNQVTRVNIATGAIVSQWSAGTGTLAGLSVFGEITQGGGGGGNITPEPTSAVLFGTGFLILAIAQRKEIGGLLFAKRAF